MFCDSCGAENRAGAKFCRKCGSTLALACPSCGSPYESGDAFCADCGKALGGRPAAASVPAASLTPAPGIQERRLVSVLFADLVGFTTLAEGRDSEETRDLLTRYFDTCRTIISRYGGVVEKFIGDAVMAVWGTPVATEDDAERAVRAALELTAAVAALGADAGAPDLKARAGVVTGEAAVNLQAQGQGMVAGDVVNTASRVQSVAEPGAVFVDGATRRSTEAAIAHEDAGAFELKGKAEPLRLWRAQRVVAGVTGSFRASGLEAPFVGREREMRLLKELFHAAGEEHKAHLLSVVGIAGIGKSRLAWEFEKYCDGIVGAVWWHRGRCLAYGEGVTYWALAEMIKMRARITEEESSESAARKLHEVVALHVPDEEERGWVEPRLAHLLGYEQRRSFERDDLFAGWRLFFERMADAAPTVLVFEDIQWADASLLDFIEYLLEWSKSHALFVLTLSRPELGDKRPGWGAGRRGFTSLFLEPLGESTMDRLLCGLVPGLPDETRARIGMRSEGVPLYAVETVRMLLDRDLLRREGDGYVLTGPLGDLDVPETLHALIAARLDGLDEPHRRLLQDAAVAGKSFTPAALAALNGRTEQELRPLLDALVVKDLLAVQADPMSPERGQYSFLQALVKQVSYDTLSKKERRTRHLAMADYLQGASGYDGDEIVEVVSSHLLEAFRAAPSVPDAPAIKNRARRALLEAAERAASLTANEEAQRYYEQAAELADEPTVKAELLEGAGRVAWMGARGDVAIAHLRAALEIFESLALTHPAGRVGARLGEVLWKSGRDVEARELLERSLELLGTEEPDESTAALAGSLGTLLFFAGEVDAAGERVEVALEIAEALWLPEILASQLITKSFVLDVRGRRAEALGILKYALELALENDLPSEAIRAYGNLAHQMQTRDRYKDALDYGRSALALARRIGDRHQELETLAAQNFTLFATGHWDEAVSRAFAVPDWESQPPFILITLSAVVLVHVARGELDEANAVLRVSDRLKGATDVEARASLAMARACTLRARSDLTQAIAAGRQAMEARHQEGWGHEVVKVGFVEAVEAAFTLGDSITVEELLALVEQSRPVEVPPFLQANVARFRARLAALAGASADVERGFKSSAGLFREIDLPFYLAITLLEHGEWLIEQSRSTEAVALLDEARAVFERLEARPWLDRLAASHPAPVPAGHSTGSS
ncbi:MAG: AAA family ATPase [Actinomycetota bacterium]|nr:AAA family ATPase [Actinomycetota bacterium]